MRTWQVILILPVLEEQFFKKLHSIRADAVILDLEDSIAPSHKTLARKKLKEFSNIYPITGKGIIIRINSLKTDFGYEDLMVALSCQPHGIMYPKVEEPEEIRTLDKYISKYEEEFKVGYNIEILPTFERCKGIVYAEEIIKSSKRITTIIFGTEDLHSELGISRKYTFSNPLFTYILAKLTLLAKVNGVSVMDGIFPYLGENELHNLKKEAQFVKQLGCVGKIAIHPNQVEVLRKVFSPRKEDILKAQEKCKLLLNISERQGLAIGVYEGTLIGLPEMRKCATVLKQAGNLKDNEKILSKINKIFIERER